MKAKDEGIEISVVMGVYNPASKKIFLKAVQSIINQSFKAWEMIVYDDGSDSDSASIIQAVAAMDTRICYIRGSKNRGLAFALNRCIQMARGRYIARMDADDVSKPDRFQILYEFLESNPQFAWVGTNSELINEEGVWGIDRRTEIPDSEDFLRFSPYIHPAVVFRKEVLTGAGGYKVSEETKRCEDYELFMRLHRLGYRGCNLQMPLLQYREDIEAYRKRKYKYFIREAKIRYKGFRALGILKLKTWPYVVKPLAVGLVPLKLTQYIKKKKKGSYISEQKAL